jgi:NAD(P)-dependent dehydrogenase (short-subunit alcohol dehydrogenase family)
MNDPLFVIDGRVMLVAGGAGGLGTPLAAALAQRGAKVLIADIDAQRAEKPARELAATHKADVRACALDVVSPQSCAAAVDLAVSAWGRLDGLVNATGIYRVAGALELDDEAWERTLEINLTGAFRLARAAGQVMVAQRSGRIVTPADGGRKEFLPVARFPFHCASTRNTFISMSNSFSSRRMTGADRASPTAGDQESSHWAEGGSAKR